MFNRETGVQNRGLHRYLAWIIDVGYFVAAYCFKEKNITCLISEFC